MTEELEANDPASRWSQWREGRRSRASRWDRPPEPHDWRFFVGHLGRTLIVTGLLMFGFVAYQLWGTGIETARAQSKLERGFQERIAALVADDEDEVGFEHWVVPDEPSTTTPTVPDDGAGVPADEVPRSVDEIPLSDLVPGGLDLSDFAVDQDVPVVPGDSFARLDIPTIGVSEYVVPGVKLSDLKRGPGHYPDTPLPGQLGNASIAGHRTTYGAPFFDLDQLAEGDELEVTMVTGDRFVYRVTGLEVVSASDYWVVTTRDPNVAELTLTTCDPKYTAENRLVVHSVLVPEKSAQVGEAEFYQLDESAGSVDEPIPGDDPTFEPADETVATVESVPTGEPAVGTTTTTVATVADDVTTTTLTDTAHADDADDLDEIDAFSQGWFDDRGAWPQIALWGLALTAVSLLGYQAAKRTRREWVGVAVALAPFLFCLYFVYQNVNRLLPPGL